MNKSTLHFAVQCSLLSIAMPIIQSFAAPPEIKTVGNHLEEKNTPGKVVRLTGANLPSLEWGSGENLTNSAAQILNVWKGNIIRLPIDQDRWLAGGTYQTTVDAIVNQVSAANAYVIIDNHGYGRPDNNTLTLWTSLANRPLYKNNPAVLFGLLNEPKGSTLTWELWRNGDATGPGIQNLLDAVRATGANNLVVAGGLNFSSDLSGVLTGGYALTDTASGNGVLYDMHIYPWHGWTSWVSCSRVLPLLLGECGHDGTSTGGTGTTFGGSSPMLFWQQWGIADAMGVNYTAWAFHLSAGPKLLQDFTAFTPTSAAGQFVMNHLLSNRSPVHKSTVVNPGFELPVASTFVYRPAAATWTFAGNAGIQKTWNTAIHGTQGGFLQSASASDAGQNGVAGSMTQTIYFDATGTYAMHFQMAQRAGKTELPVKVSVDGVPISSFSYTPTDALGDNAFTPVATAPFTINTTGNHTIKLEANAPSGISAEALIDNVSVSQMAPGIIVDQGFQTTVKSNGSALSSGQFRYRPSNSGWTFEGNSGVEYNALGAPVAPEGRFPMAAFLQTAVGADVGGQDAVTANGIDGSISTSIEFAAPGVYSFRMKAATRSGKGNLAVQIYVDGELIGSVTPASTAFSTYDSPPFTIDYPGYHTIKLAATPSSTADNQAFIDATIITVPAASYTRLAPVSVPGAGFESPSSATVTSFAPPTGTPWTFAGKCGIHNDLSGIRNYDAHHAAEGWQAVTFQGDGITPGSITQTVNFPATGEYVINFQAQRGRNGVVPITLYVDGVVVGTHTPTKKAYYPYSTAPFSVTGGNHVVKLECPLTSSTTSGVWTLIDAINILPVSVAAGGGTLQLAEAELLAFTATDATAIASDGAASGGQLLKLSSNAIGDSITFTVPNVPAGTYTIKIGFKKGNDRGIAQLAIDGIDQGAAQDTYYSGSQYAERDLGSKTFGATGDRSFRFTIVGKNAGSSSYAVAIDYIKLVP